MLQVSIIPVNKIADKHIEKLCLNAGLRQTMKGSLRSIAENTHWHFKRGKQKGVLEITLMHQTREIILAVHDNRRGGWEDEVMRFIQAQVA